MGALSFIDDPFNNVLASSFGYSRKASLHGRFFLDDFLLYFVALLPSVRWGLTNRYAKFTLIAEDARTNENLFLAHKLLPWRIIARICWENIWRIYFIALLTAGVLLLLVYVAPQKTLEALDVPIVLIMFFAGYYFWVSLWALKASLADRYRSFRFSIVPK